MVTVSPPVSPSVVAAIVMIQKPSVTAGTLLKLSRAVLPHMRKAGAGSIINMASTLRLIPTKGMTLPFISYGGSSVIAIALGMGMLLALTRRRGRDEPA